jgi:hypothetical protein
MSMNTMILLLITFSMTKPAFPSFPSFPLSLSAFVLDAAYAAQTYFSNIYDSRNLHSS